MRIQILILGVLGLICELFQQVLHRPNTTPFTDLHLGWKRLISYSEPHSIIVRYLKTKLYIRKDTGFAADKIITLSDSQLRIWVIQIDEVIREISIETIQDNNTKFVVKNH